MTSLLSSYNMEFHCHAKLLQHNSFKGKKNDVSKRKFEVTQLKLRKCTHLIPVTLCSPSSACIPPLALISIKKMHSFNANFY